MLDAATARLKETVDLLDGARGARSRGRAALRLEDLRPLLGLPALRSEHAAGGSVTTDEFDALVDDVHALHQRLSALSAAIQLRLDGR